MNKCTEDNVPAISGQSAFFLILSVVPFIMFAVSVLSYLGKANIIPLPEGMLEYTGDNEVIGMLSNTVKNASSGTSVITAILSLWTAGRGMYIITEGINRIYRLPKKSFWLIKRIYAMGYTLIMLLIMMISFAILSVGILFSTKLNTLMDNILPDWLNRTYVLVLTDILLIIFMTLAMKLYLIRKVSDRRFASFKALLPGSIITVLMWNLFIFGMSVYTKFFSGSSVYGSLGTIALFMMMIYFMMFILLCGIQLNYIYRHYFLTFKLRKLFEKKKNLKKQGQS